MRIAKLDEALAIVDVAEQRVDVVQVDGGDLRRVGGVHRGSGGRRRRRQRSR